MENWTNSELQDDDITQDYLQAVQWELEPAHDVEKDILFLLLALPVPTPNLNIEIGDISFFFGEFCSAEEKMQLIGFTCICINLYWGCKSESEYLLFVGMLSCSFHTLKYVKIIILSCLFHTLKCVKIMISSFFFW